MSEAAGLAATAGTATVTRHALEASGLVAGYGAMTVLRALDLAVAPGEIVGVLGANGMGKTTLMKALAGLVPAHAGAIRTLGRDVTRLAAHERARLGIGYVPQGRGILVALSVEENLRIAWRGDASAEPEMDAVARAVALFPRLQRLLDRPGGALSGGEQQLLALARALVPAPWLLLLDEPTEGIQPNIIDEIAATLKGLRESEGLTILVAEQNLDFILDCADRVLLLEKGAITQQLSRAQLADPRVLSAALGFAAPGGAAPRANALPSRQQLAGAVAHQPAPFIQEQPPMTLRRPDIEQLRAIAGALHMHPSEAELGE
ncbi:MAG: ABC transporter ATP-binding protein, partial [Comamonadaceae bacterium]